MKKTITIFTLACAVVLNLTACKDTSSGEESTSNQLPVNASNGMVEVTTSRGESGASGNTSNDTSIAILPPVPERGVIMLDSNKLGEFVINGSIFDMSSALTPDDIIERLGSGFGNWGNELDGTKKAELYDSAEHFDKKAGYRFCGAGFSFSGWNDAIYIEALDENGELVTDWQCMSTEQARIYGSYSVKGVRFSAQHAPDFVHFICGFKVGNPPEYYEGILSKGYEIEQIDDENSDKSYKLSIYKTSTVTMVIEYRLTETRKIFPTVESEEANETEADVTDVVAAELVSSSVETDNDATSPWYCESITLIKN